MYENKVFILKRGIKEEVYGNISIMCREEELDYGIVYRSLRRSHHYYEEGLLITEKVIKKSKRPNHKKKK